MKEEKAYYGDAPVYLTFLNKQEFLKLENPVVSSVHCFPIKNGNILFTVNQRGLDIIGGHVEKGETPEQALLRECMEEACIKLESFSVIGAIQVDNRDNPHAAEKGYAPIGYQLFFTSNKYVEQPFKADFESTERQYVSFDNVKDKHHKWLRTHEDILNEMRTEKLHLVKVERQNKTKRILKF